MKPEQVEQLEKSMYSLIAVCLDVMKLNPRTKEHEKNALYKGIRSFARTFREIMLPDERVEMAQNFFSEYYLDAIRDESVHDWLIDNVVLKFGDDKDQIKLRLSDYYRVAQDIDGMKSSAVESKKSWTKEIKYQVLTLLIVLASDSIAEILSEKIEVLEQELGKKTKKEAPAGPMASILESLSGKGGGGLNDLMKNMMENIAPAISGLTQSSEFKNIVQSMTSNPGIGDMMKGMTANMDAPARAQLDSVMSDLQSGNLDVQKMFASLTNLKASATEASVSELTETPQESNMICDGDVCYIGSHSE